MRIAATSDSTRTHPGRRPCRGQADYAGANDVLNRLAWWMRAAWPSVRVVSVNWGPWSGTGMATPATQSALRQLGILPIAPEAGCAFLMEELARGSRADLEVIAGEGPWHRRPPAERLLEAPVM